ncbi:GYF domain-containing protein [Melittangium boletus]|uniref:Uncharacterized protein n=1 Tax=Melittangium boletus DSM 14713 TaxID=1294270 RepID=A0A250I9Q0_9BACT|nr:GYF domain-containing protein [Melittangium boletus]ATB27930.1 hypothetical protein MEBOL_001375 [Melittangium boletus DSM 14713]
MNFSCNKCQRRYSIADDKVRGKTVKVRCKNCQNVISVEGPPAELEESTRVVSLADVERLREQDRSLAEEEAAVQAAPAAGGWEDEPTRAMPAGEAAASWFVMIKSKQEGPLDEGALRALVAEGTVTPRSYFWQQGMADWKRGQELPALEGIFVAEEPPAVAAPPPAAPEPEPEPEPTPAARSSTSWQPEPPLPSQTTWSTEPEPAARAAPASTPWEPEPESAAAPSDVNAPSAQLGELFSDLDLPQSSPSEEEPDRPLVDSRLDEGRSPALEASPAASKSVKSASKPGARRRSPALKILLVLVLLVVVPVGLLIALTETQVIPLRVTRADAQGRLVREPVSIFSAEGVEELRNLLLGNSTPPPPAPKPAPAAPPAAPAPEAPAAQEKQAPAEPQDAPAPDETAAAPGDAVGDELTPLGDAAPQGDAPAAPPPGPPQAEVARVVDASRPGFKPCIDQALRKNPKLRNGKLLLITTVGSSGEVKQVAFDRADIGASPSGECFNERARELVFPAFSGEDVEIEIPLVLKSR